MIWCGRIVFLGFILIEICRENVGEYYAIFFMTHLSILWLISWGKGLGAIGGWFGAIWGEGLGRGMQSIG